MPARERPELRLHGPDWRGGRAAAERLRADLRLEGSVSIGGPVYGEEKWRLLEQAAGFVYPSRWEAFGLAPAEAVALGVPTLMSPVPLGRFLAARGAAIVADDLADGLDALASARGLRGVEVAASELSRDRVARSFLEQLAAVR
jgi:glycosyltransferase involved in cell wall biosynthesis